jgi:hypothetical protein
VNAPVMHLVNVVMALVMSMKTVKPVKLIAVNVAHVMMVMYQTVLIMIVVQNLGLAMALKTVQISNLAVIFSVMIMMAVIVHTHVKMMVMLPAGMDHVQHLKKTAHLLVKNRGEQSVGMVRVQ